MKKKKEKMIPAATIRGTYSTYENSKQRDLNQRLGHVVDLKLENMATIELGGWGTEITIILPKGVSFSTKQLVDFDNGKPNGKTVIFLSKK